MGSSRFQVHSVLLDGPGRILSTRLDPNFKIFSLNSWVKQIFSIGLLCGILSSTPCYSLEFTPEVRTVALSRQDRPEERLSTRVSESPTTEFKTVVLSRRQVRRGRRLFNSACATCHVGGLTKPNPNVGLDIQSLRGAVPPRDNIEALVQYLKSPRTYDDFASISELHPSIECADLFQKMRTFTEEDLFEISGHILYQAKTQGERWGGGKIYY